MKIISWNVNGIRAIMKKDFEEQFKSINADVFCLQETKAQVDQVKEALDWLDEYYIYANQASKKRLFRYSIDK
jgi:exodeoxyribonuclease-3